MSHRPGRRPEPARRRRQSTPLSLTRSSTPQCAPNPLISSPSADSAGPPHLLWPSMAGESSGESARSRLPAAEIRPGRESAPPGNPAPVLGGAEGVGPVGELTAFATKRGPVGGSRSDSGDSKGRSWGFWTRTTDTDGLHCPARTDWPSDSGRERWTGSVGGQPVVGTKINDGRNGGDVSGVSAHPHARAGLGGWPAARQA